MIPSIPARDKYLKLAERSVDSQTYKEHEKRFIVDETINANQARNRGLKEGRGEFIALLDDDDEWLPQKNDKQIMEMREHPECPLCVTYSKDLRFGMVRIAKPPNIVTRKDILKSFNISSSSTYMIRASALDKIGFFDESLPSSQEYDLAIRLASVGDIRCVPEVLVVQNESVGQISRNWKKKIQGTIGIYKKYHSEYNITGHVKFIGLISMFFLGYLFGTKIYKILIPLKERYESV